MISYTAFGAAGEVTGSKHILTINGDRILLDCGMVQGGHEDLRTRNATLPFAANTIDAVIVSHAHYDHVGLLPLFVRSGYRGPIFSTGATRDLTELILLDAAKIQEQEAAYINEHALPGEPPIEPLYTIDDVAPVMELFQRIPYTTAGAGWQRISGHAEAKLYDAGHILGSAVAVVRARDGGPEETVVYTGDLGRPGAPLLRDPQIVTDPATTLISESTYGARLHHGFDAAEQELCDVVNEAVKRGSKIVVPAFSLGRTQQLVYLLHRLTDEKKIPRLPVIIDSPLASRITEAFTKHQHDYDAETKIDFSRHGEDPLEFTNLEHTQSVDESKALNTRPGPFVIISASGMASGGRVVHHLKNVLPDPNGIILFTGYQADRTLGRRLLQGAKQVHLFGRSVPVKAEIRSINDLSAHADAHELVAYAESIQGLQRVFYVHGEVDRATSLMAMTQAKHPDWQLQIPDVGKEYTW